MKAFMINVKKYIRYAWIWYASQFKGVWYQRIVAPIATFFVAFFLYLGAVDCNFLGLFGLSPTMECIENPVSSEASMVYSADSVLLGKFFSENRSPVKFEEISPYVINALISTEDERFYQHHGIDYQGLFAAVKDMSQGNARGASTITQQLIKNCVIENQERSYSRKLIEVLLAPRIEQRYSKDKIMEF